jgi:hypothetical protein
VLRFEVLEVVCKFLNHHQKLSARNVPEVSRSTPRDGASSIPERDPNRKRIDHLNQVARRCQFLFLPQLQQQILREPKRVNRRRVCPSELPAPVDHIGAIAVSSRLPLGCSTSLKTQPTKVGTQKSIGIWRRVGTWVVRVAQRSDQKMRLSAHSVRSSRRTFRL